MLRTLNIEPRVPTVHGVLIRRQAVDEQVRAYTTVSEARRYAKKMVKDALLKAEQIENAAMQAGFKAGWLDSLNAIANALRDTDRFCDSVDNAVKLAVQETLLKTVSQPELALHLIDGWLTANTPVAGKLQVIVPKQAASQVEAIRNRLRGQADVVATVSVGQGDSVVLQFNDQGVEFAPDRTIGEISELVQRCFHRLEVRKQCAAWSHEITAGWIAGLAQSHGAPQRHHTEPSDFDQDDDAALYGEPVEAAVGEPVEVVVQGKLSDASISYEEQMDQDFFGDFEDDPLYEQIE